MNVFSEGFNVDIYLGGISSGTCASGFGVCCVCKFLRLLIQVCLQFLRFFVYFFKVLCKAQTFKQRN